MHGSEFLHFPARILLAPTVSPREPHYQCEKNNKETIDEQGTPAYASVETKRNNNMNLKSALMTGLLLAVVSTAKSQTTFTKITTGPVATDLGIFSYAAWGDFRGLGYLDLVVGDYGGRTNSAYYRNNGDRTFTRIMPGGPLGTAAYLIDPVPADFENHDHLDLLVTGVGGATGLKYNVICCNNGDGTFSAVSGGGVTNITGHFNGCALADIDNDGAVDVYVPGYNGGISLLFRNNGDGTFSRVLSGPPIISMNN